MSQPLPSPRPGCLGLPVSVAGPLGSNHRLTKPVCLALANPLLEGPGLLSEGKKHWHSRDPLFFQHSCLVITQLTCSDD